jgi:LacI family transcriptional regulator
MAHVSLRDIAEHAGVSFQTVGKALNGEGRIAPETRQRILEAAAELGYVPNTVARSLKTRSTRSIGFVASGLASYVLTPLMRGVEREATAQGYFSIFTLAESDGSHIDQLVRQLLERRVDGVVSAAIAHQSYAPLIDLLRTAVPSVSAVSHLGDGIPFVGEDHHQTGRLTAEHLTALGHWEIAAITGDPEWRPIGGRLRSFAAALGVTDTDWPDRLVASGLWTAAGGYGAMNKLLDRAPEITAVFALNDHMAIGAMHALRQRGLRIPEDISIVGCDDIELARFTDPPLTTIRISFEDIGATAVRLLLSRIGGEVEVPPGLDLPVELIVRGSTGPVLAN